MTSCLSTPVIGVLISEFNTFITEALYQGALKALEAAGYTSERLKVYRVPGALELPMAAQRLIQNHPNVEGIVALGAVIQGATPHFDCVVEGSMQGLMRVQLETNKPIAFGILTVNTVEQALERCGIRGSNRGQEAAETLLQCLAVYQRMAQNGLN